MADSISVHVVHAGDAGQHLGHLTKILKDLQSEKRIDSYNTIDHVTVTAETFDSLVADDMVITLLTNGLIGQQAEIEQALISIKLEKPKYKMVEVIIDNIPYHEDFIALPTTLEPIRESEDMDAVWNGIGMALREIFPVRKIIDPPPSWKKYIPYMVGIIVFGGLLFWLFQGKQPKADFSYRVLDPIKGDVVSNAEECYIPCKVFLNDRSENASSLKWDLKDTIISDNPEPEHVYLSPGDYDMKLIASNGGKEHLAIKKLMVKGPPFASFEVVNKGCQAPCDPQFKNTSLNATSFTWTFEGATPNSSDKENPGPVMYTANGDFKVTLSATNADGIKSDTTQVVSVIPDNTTFASFTPSKVTNGYGKPQVWKFNNNSKNATSYKWDFGDGSLPVATFEPQHTFKEYGTYVVTLQVVGETGMVQTFAPVSVRSNKFGVLIDHKIYNKTVYDKVMTKKFIVPGINN